MSRLPDDPQIPIHPPSRWLISLHVVGKTRFPFAHEGHPFTFEGLVVENFYVNVLAGTPFMKSNDIAVLQPSAK